MPKDIEDRNEQRFLSMEPSCVVELQPSVWLTWTARWATLVSHPTFSLQGHVANRGPNTAKVLGSASALLPCEGSTGASKHSGGSLFRVTSKIYRPQRVEVEVE